MFVQSQYEFFVKVGTALKALTSGICIVVFYFNLAPQFEHRRAV